MGDSKSPNLNSDILLRMKWYLDSKHELEPLRANKIFILPMMSLEPGPINTGIILLSFGHTLTRLLILTGNVQFARCRWNAVPGIQILRVFLISPRVSCAIHLRSSLGWSTFDLRFSSGQRNAIVSPTTWVHKAMSNWKMPRHPAKHQVRYTLGGQCDCAFRMLLGKAVDLDFSKWMQGKGYICLGWGSDRPLGSLLQSH